jgi:hypothetical protein
VDINRFFIRDFCLPAISPQDRPVPFADLLHKLFFDPPDDSLDFPIHGPNALRFVQPLIKCEFDTEPGLVSSDDEHPGPEFLRAYREVSEALGIAGDPRESERIIDLLQVAVLYHDIGKFIRKANHPAIGANLLRNYSPTDSQALVDSLSFTDLDDAEAKHNRFSLVTSIVQHHDKFGVASTGEGGLGLFSDILYFRSDRDAIGGIKKNITSVMLANLADIAAVFKRSEIGRRDRALRVAKDIGIYREQNSRDDRELLDRLKSICCQPEVCLGLGKAKVANILEDWRILIKWVDDARVEGDRVRLKRQLMELERNPARTITRILRLLQESIIRSKCERLADNKYLSSTSVESVLVGTLGAHQFQSFCEVMASVAKLDYGLAFFQAVVCASVRKELDDEYRATSSTAPFARPFAELTEAEQTGLEGWDDAACAKVANKITILVVRVLQGILNRYMSLLTYSSADARRFGFQMRSLTADKNIQSTILDFLCVEEHKDPIALTWLVDEVTLWCID